MAVLGPLGGKRVPNLQLFGQAVGLIQACSLLALLLEKRGLGVPAQGKASWVWDSLWDHTLLLLPPLEDGFSPFSLLCSWLLLKGQWVVWSQHTAAVSYYRPAAAKGEAGAAEATGIYS